MTKMFFFFNDTATTEIYTLSLHDALPICHSTCRGMRAAGTSGSRRTSAPLSSALRTRSEEHTSELQSPCNLVCRLLLEKKKKHQCQPEPSNDHALPLSMSLAASVKHVPML